MDRSGRGGGGIFASALKAVLVVALVTLGGCGATVKVPLRDQSYAPADAKGVHRVRRGDTLYSIAWSAGLDYRSVAQWNGIRPPYVIRPGQRLRLKPPPGTAKRRAPAKRTPQPGTPRRPAAPKPKPPVDRTRESARPAQQTSVRGWTWPAEGRLVQGYSAGGNKGIDIAGRYGQTVRCAAAGRVVYAGSGLRGYGKLIIVKHNDTFLSAYAHNRNITVAEGDQVKRGQKIAEMGSTGTNQIKLHFEIRRRGVPVDPLRYLPKR